MWTCIVLSHLCWSVISSLFVQFVFIPHTEKTAYFINAFLAQWFQVLPKKASKMQFRACVSVLLFLGQSNDHCIWGSVGFILFQFVLFYPFSFLILWKIRAAQVCMQTNTAQISVISYNQSRNGVHSIII